MTDISEIARLQSELEQAQVKIGEMEKRSGEIAERTVKQFERYEAELEQARRERDEALKAEEVQRTKKEFYHEEHAKAVVELADLRGRLEKIVELRKKQLRLSCPDCCCDCLDRPDCCPGEKYDKLLKIANGQAIKKAGEEV